ncbi:MAG: cytochrome bc complex cytochrome b subunit [Ignavibacteriales bacterium]|nr:cytochrome bc complex cytochrome b subunit [Ignavibacteriales bacterium]
MQWLDERYNLSALREFAKKKSVPKFRETIWYYFGGIALLLFVVQVITGILLLMYYKGTEDIAYESVRFIDAKVNFGWLIRSVHSWSANLMILSIVIHMFSVYFLKAFRKPRELTWYTGIALLLISMAFGFSGYLLPWNELAYFATKVGTDIVGQVPFVGKFMLTLMRGGEDVTGATLSRFFGFHVALFPGIFVIFLTLHLLFIQRQGISEPDDWAQKEEKEKKTIPFFPNFVLRELLIWLIVINILAILAVYFPWELGNKADSFAPAPQGIKPEWYFLFMFQVLKYIPGKIWMINGEIIGILFFGLAGLLWIIVPFWDVKLKPGYRNRVITYTGLGILAFIIVFTIIAFIAG